MAVRLLLRAGFTVFSVIAAVGAVSAPLKVDLDWSDIVAVSKSNIGIQDCPEPPLYRGQPIHDKLYAALHDLNADYSRLQPWFPYPKLAVAELRPPEGTRTYWDFSLLDQIVEDFMKATAGHPVVFQPGTIPAWMTSSAPPRYPEDPQAIDWEYGRDGKIGKSTIQQFADYQARLASWYMKGGFQDELGVWHPSGHAYRFAYWEPLNEEDERFSPEEVTRLYDAAVEAVGHVAPSLKFVGPTLSNTPGHPAYISYFLDPKNHRPGTPIDLIAYHFYTVWRSDETSQIAMYTTFHDADTILVTVGYIEAIRKRLLPDARTDIDELGSIVDPAKVVPMPRPIPASYWNLSAAVWAYLYGNLAAQGIDVLTAAELIDYPGQFAGTTLVNWKTGAPNAHYWVVKLLHDNFEPGDKLVARQPEKDMERLDPALQLYAQGFISPTGKRKVLLVNKRDRPIDVTVVGALGGNEQRVDQSTAGPATARILTHDTFQLTALAVSVVTLR